MRAPTSADRYHRDVPPRIVVIGGPTATGKTALSVSLAKTFGGEIVNADSTQVYRGMDIGTAKPTEAEKGGVPHHLFDIRDPDAQLSAAEWVRLADAALADISARGKLPILAGGSGFYIRALLYGLFDAPEVDADVKARLEEEARTDEGFAALRKRLEEADPAAAAKIHPNDRFRTLRALEIFESSGEKISDLHEKDASWKGEARYPALIVGLNLPRELLYERIDARQAAQVRAGLLEEYRALLAKGYSPDLRLLNGLCYRHMRWVHEGTMTLEEAIRLDQRDNRRYAKRQLTWFKSTPGIRWFDPRTDEQAIFQAVRDFLE